ncbi:hypothetical protein DTO013E5_9489 [Penicillium roqueforti]|nr:hypothetical protein DTO012A1_9437 [Penicillium roqueforti]KAI2741626.1 hypothetical protein DTO013F2_8757 [Penicillium roqueforti]KAI3067537.1 hypothetical protein CBS147339_8492 [Penicillium roqueforti]KAI3090540.1 hypothetical protein CBS147338_8859 [Penicillium roqueforti]KAI3129934.1 hypothetical protein CBS147325_9453 [Penicillium roqueforti]
MDNELQSIIELPTIADIEASTDVLSIRTNAIKVVRVKERFAVKIGFTPTSSTQRPRKDMSLWISSLRIRQAINELRAIPSPGYFGNLNGTPYIDGVLSTPDNNPIISGPFKDQKQMNQGILERLGQMQSPHYIRLLKEMVNRTLKNHRIVFTHGDLQPKNIIVERKGVCNNGDADFKVTLIDWNLSGWYPEFWDFCNSTLYCQMKPDWLELIPDIFDQYPIEYLMMQVVYSSVFY